MKRNVPVEVAAGLDERVQRLNEIFARHAAKRVTALLSGPMVIE